MSDQGSYRDGHDTALPNMKITAREYLIDFMTAGEPQLRLCAQRGMQDVGRRMSVYGCTMAGVKRKASALGLDWINTQKRAKSPELPGNMVEMV